MVAIEAHHSSFQMVPGRLRTFRYGFFFHFEATAFQKPSSVDLLQIEQFSARGKHLRLRRAYHRRWVAELNGCALDFIGAAPELSMSACAFSFSRIIGFIRCPRECGSRSMCPPREWYRGRVGRTTVSCTSLLLVQKMFQVDSSEKDTIFNCNLPAKASGLSAILAQVPWAQGPYLVAWVELSIWPASKAHINVPERQLSHFSLVQCHSFVAGRDWQFFCPTLSQLRWVAIRTALFR